ncbi:lymphocyte antigen 86 [Bombina bombina]|uniref:lymphocyte antigen 86 n=1 Tax=Bombina bombina TaxID=8345 RepID=UPI00235AE83E|nr:lymphocyte antigen 86 [Bombina bombina]
MKILVVMLFCFCLLCPGDMKEWPTHEICKKRDFEAYYKSCDPVQDIGVSIEPCSRTAFNHFHLKIGVLLRQDINELYSNINVYVNGYYVLNIRKPLCEKTTQIVSICGKQKGEFIIYDGNVNIGSSAFPEGDYVLNMNLVNENNFLIGCANLTVNIH